MSPAPINASMKAIRSATLIGVFSFCSPSRGPTSTMWTRSLMTRCRFDFGKFDAFADDIADLAFDLLQHARIGRAQGLLHLHDFERQDRSALFQRRALLGQQRHHRARQRRHDLVLADLLLGLAAERIDPVQVEAAVAGAQIKLMALDHGNNARFHAVDRQIEARRHPPARSRKRIRACRSRVSIGPEP